MTSATVTIPQLQITHGSQSSVFSHPQYGRVELHEPIRTFWQSSREHYLGLPVANQQRAEVNGRMMDFVPFERGIVFIDAETKLPFDVRPDVQDAATRVHALYGKWDAPFEAGVVGVHAALLHINCVLLFTYSSKEGPNFPKRDGEWSLLNLDSGKQVINGELIGRNLFCAGHCLLGDGRLLVVGGERNYDPALTPGQPTDLNQKAVYTYDPEQHAWLEGRNMLERRWYPTVATIGSGVGMAIGGTDFPFQIGPSNPPTTATSSAIYVSPAGPQTSAMPFGAAFTNLDLQSSGGTTAEYPFVYLLPDGRTFIHYRHTSFILPRGVFDFSRAQTAYEGRSRCCAAYGTSVMLPLRATNNYAAKIMVMGGPLERVSPPSRECSIIDTSAAEPRWVPAASMREDRNFCDAVLLPDGKVLVINGCRYEKAFPLFSPELYDPESDTWIPYPLAATTTPRLYHSTALLLPDGCVITAGTDAALNRPEVSSDITRLERYWPPSLFAGPRPQLRWTPREIAYDSVFEVAANDVAQIRSVAVIRNGSCTHGINTDQRFIEIPIVERTALRRWVVPGLSCGSLYRTFHSEGLKLRAPPNSYVAPPGYYMLFLVSAAGVPARAQFVRFVARYRFWTLVGKAASNILRIVFGAVFPDRRD